LSAVRSRIEGGTQQAPSRLIELAYSWFEDLKTWEKEETFKRAFDQNRMTLRLLTADASKAKDDYTRNVPGWGANKNDDGTFKKTGVSTEVFLSGGLKGLKDRLNPSNFARQSPSDQSLKNALGLHDLSARVLDKRLPIGKQGFNFTKTSHAIFMPVPAEADHVVFYTLNHLSKTDEDLKSDPQFVEAVRFIRARLTRVKLAEKNDMGAAFVVVQEPGTGRTKIRYGYTGKVTEAPKKNTLTFAEELKLKKLKKMDPNEDKSPSLTAAQLTSRITTAWRYTTVLRTAMEPGNNEIIIAYRQHASPNFPMIATWPDDGQNPGYYVVKSNTRLPGIDRVAILHDNGTLETF
jgi:hypothetical protein